MNMIGYQNPGKALGLRLSENVTQSSNKRFPVGIVSENFLPLNPSGDDMLKKTWGIESS
jgi:hypothetical protein